MKYFEIFINLSFVLFLSWYLIVNLQWYNYKLSRVIFKHHKWHWHIFYFIIPIVLFYILPVLYFLIYFFILYIPTFIYWNLKLDRPLKLTSRVKRYFLLLVFASVIINYFVYLYPNYNRLVIIFPLIFSYRISILLESILFKLFIKKAKQKLKDIKNLKIIAITASFGKTSIKNYLYHVLKSKYNVYKTPRSVNTIAGIVLDVNNDLPSNTNIYIAEAGARQKGDIEEIVRFLKPQISIIGSVGEQHIEYFKTLDNIKKTKKEILKSENLEQAFIHNSVEFEKNDIFVSFPNNLKIIKSNLEGLCFEIEVNGILEEFKAPILGSFNAVNLSAVILTASYLGMSIEQIKKSLMSIPQVEHRLQKIEANDKLIIDDSFNGNLEGMLEAINICSTYDGRKVIITPGLVESTKEANQILAKQINKYFDFVILTGSLNIDILKSNIDENKIFILKDKSKMQEALLEYTRSKDLILFANDAPNFI